MPETLGSAFVGPGGRWVIVDGRTVYGPFHSPDVAHCWRGDMGLRTALLLEITPPPKAPAQPTEDER